MNWIWQEENWFDFKYDAKALEELEKQFLRQAGLLEGAAQHIDPKESEEIFIDLACDEALFSSEIEGEYLNRDSLRSSLKKNLGLPNNKNEKILPAEDGMGKMISSLYKTFNQPLNEKQLADWQLLVMRGRWDIAQVGCYRTHSDPMQIVSGAIGREKVHYEAPPSDSIPKEMKCYINWFNQTAPSSSNAIPILIRAGIAHLYFELVHPFEDGNGRIGRAIALKSLFQSLGQPTILVLSDIINKDKKNYYNALARQNQSNEITEWLIYFAKIILKAQQQTKEIINFVIAKKKFYEHFENRLNERQKKVIARLFRAGTDGFEGGLSAKNYIKIANTSASTATRDLQELVDMGALRAEGELKARRYFLLLGLDVA